VSLCQQIFGNLILNALKYTPRHGHVHVAGTVTIDSWCFVVEDDGPGIPIEAQEQVFQPFFRLPRDENARLEGNGLGLSICRELTEQLGGKIALRSMPGAGTSVEVSFSRS
jgi:two-component system sensor histidine kinase EvgS